MISRVFREPLLYFLLAGATLFAVGERFAPSADAQIRVTSAERQRLHDQWLAQVGSAPSAAELERLVEQWIREEIYYREALALGLDEGDVIVRRRLVQKLAFLTEDLAVTAEPTPAELATYHQAHQDRYRQPERVSFSQRYFSSQRHSNAEAVARAALGREDVAGDPFMLPRSYADRTPDDVAELFGAAFAERLATLAEGTWDGPIQSAYGWHLVKVESRAPARHATFEEVRARVRDDLLDARRAAANEAFYESLRSRYQVVDS